MGTSLPLLIGLGYQKRCGKDELARRLRQCIRAHGFVATTYSIAAPLKEMVHSVFGVPWSNLNGDDSIRDLPIEAHGGRSGRQLLQEVGCTMRDAWPGIWAQALVHRDWGDTDVAIIPDVRFADEADLIRESGGFLVKVVRTGAPSDPHPSEHQLDGYSFDLTYENNGTLADMQSFARNVAKFVNGQLTPP